MVQNDMAAKSRRAKNPEATREVILEAARTLLSQSGPEALSLSEVAQLAGVNRGTAYQHFETRENLIKATTQWVSDSMFRAVFGDPESIGERRVEQVDPADTMDRLTQYAMQNPELCRIWFLQLLASPDPSSDPFWREFAGSLRRFSETDLAQEGVDSEVWSVMLLAGTFLWPLWVGSHARDDADRQSLARRFAQECLRLSMYGSMKSERFPEIVARLRASSK